MGFSGFELMTGQSPQVIPPLTILPPSPDSTNLKEDEAMKQAKAVPQTLRDDIQVDKDNLLLSKVTQTAHKNKHQSAEIWYNVGDKVMLLTFHHHHEYIQKGKNHVAKFMP